MPHRGQKTVILTAIFTAAFFVLCSIVSVVGVVSGIFPDTVASRTMEKRQTEHFEATGTAEQDFSETATFITIAPDELRLTSVPTVVPISSIVPAIMPSR